MLLRWVLAVCAVGVVRAETMGPWEGLLMAIVKTHANSASSSQGGGNQSAWLPMNVTTKVAVGMPDVTIYGDTKSINAQILKMNPNYKLEDFLSGNEDTVVPAGVPSTAIIPPLCNIWPESGSVNLLEEGIMDLNASFYPVVVPTKSCVALSCIDGASIGICNDNKEPITKITRNLVVYLKTMLDSCLSSTGTVNGQIFDSGGFNLIFNAGHCTPTAHGANYQADKVVARSMGTLDEGRMRARGLAEER